MKNGLRFLRAEWDRAAGWGCVALALALLMSGIAGVRNAVDLVDEVSYLVSGGIGAMFVLGVGATLLLTADLHDDWRKLDRLERKLDQLLADRPDPAGSDDDGLTELVVGDADVTPEIASPGSRMATHPAGALAVTRTRRVLAMTTAAAGALFLIGWSQTANGTEPAQLSRGVSVALTGMLVVAVAAATTLVRHKAALASATSGIVDPWLSTIAPAAPADSDDDAADHVWMVDGLPRYHTGRCRAVAGRAGAAIRRADLPATATACGLCEPDGTNP